MTTTTTTTSNSSTTASSTATTTATNINDTTAATTARQIAPPVTPICTTKYGLHIIGSNVMKRCGLVSPKELIDNFHYLSPSIHFNNDNVKDASAAYTYTLVLTENNKLFVSGATYTFLKDDYMSSSPVGATTASASASASSSSSSVSSISPTSPMSSSLFDQYRYSNNHMLIERSTFRQLPMPADMLGSSIRHIMTLQKCIICIDDQMNFWTVGANSHGEMGVGDKHCPYQFTRLRPLEEETFLKTQFSDQELLEMSKDPKNKPFSFSNLTHATHGAYHVVLVFNKRHVFTVGFNGCGELCIGSTDSRNYYQRVNFKFPANVRLLSIGLNHNIFLLEDNSVYVSGYNAFGQLALGHYQNATTLTKLEDPSVVNNRIRDVSTGYHHTVFLTEDYRVFACGWNKDYTILLQSTGPNYCNLIEITTMIRNVCSSPFDICCGGYTIFVNSGGCIYVSGRLTEKKAFEPQGTFNLVMIAPGSRCKMDSGYSHALLLCTAPVSDADRMLIALAKRSVDKKLSDVSIMFLR